MQDQRPQGTTVPCQPVIHDQLGKPDRGRVLALALSGPYVAATVADAPQVDQQAGAPPPQQQALHHTHRVQYSHDAEPAEPAGERIGETAQGIETNRVDT